MGKKVICTICQKKFGSIQIEKHKPICYMEQHMNESGYFIEFRSYSYITNKIYKLYVIFGLNCKFTHIDKFLRKIWCECCNHLSEFYFFKDAKSNSENIKKNSFLKNYEENVGNFGYDYDMGSTTTIYFKIISKLNGNEINTKNKIIYRNEPPVIMCDVCNNEPSVYVYDEDCICNNCIINDESDNESDEDNESENNKSNENKQNDKNNENDSNDSDNYETIETFNIEDFVLPIVNSPRVGICGYQ